MSIYKYVVALINTRFYRSTEQHSFAFALTKSSFKFNNYISLRGGVRSDLWENRIVLTYSVVVVNIYDICIWCFINDLFVACVDGMYGQNCAQNCTWRLCCLQYGPIKYVAYGMDRSSLNCLQYGHMEFKLYTVWKSFYMINPVSLRCWQYGPIVFVRRLFVSDYYANQGLQ
jgi:hypothetical protein